MLAVYRNSVPPTSVIGTSAIYCGALPVTNGEPGIGVRMPVFVSMAKAAILLFALVVPTRPTYKIRPLPLIASADGPGKVPVAPVTNGEPEIGVRAPVF